MLTIKPLIGGEQKKALSLAVVKGLGRLTRDEHTGAYLIENTWPTAQPLDKRWFKRLTHAVWKRVGSRAGNSSYVYWEAIDGFALMLMRLADPADEELREELIPYFRTQMEKDGPAWDDWWKVR